MINWQSILWELRRNYKPIAAIAREVEYHPKSLQTLAKGNRRHDLPYTVGKKLLDLYAMHCVNKY